MKNYTKVRKTAGIRLYTNLDKKIFENIGFIYPFRDYQTRVLDQMQHMMKDNKLHVAAAPGAGKTVLGLEVIRRLNKRALIFVPTINLRDQWKERFLGGFIDSDKYPGLREKWNQDFSTDLKNPGIITCSTYQALYHIYSEYMESGDDGFRKLTDFYKSQGIQTICLDEAHHLKREWAKALSDFITEMNPQLIALTATPPMDTSNIEWKRYIQLCGDIDIEISIPEMVSKKCLCPHQDYLYICTPDAAEQKQVNSELARNLEVEEEILGDAALYKEIKELPFLKNPTENAEILIKYPDYLQHILGYISYIKDKHLVVFEGDRFLAEKAFDLWDKRIQDMIGPVTDISEWFLPLMQDILENDAESFSADLKNRLTERLTKEHMMKNKKVSGQYSRDKLDKILIGSVSKLSALENIITEESRSMGTDLRCLVLMDHIRKEDISKVETDQSLTDLGVSTVFERLRREEHLGNLEKYLAIETEDNPSDKRVYRLRLGVLTGSIVILPDGVMDALVQEAEYTGKTKRLGITGYSLLEISGDMGSRIVTLVTRYFSEGRIEILIGTSALLGEGWDAPAVNTLIIGSTSSMYVKTNQMRGRALRILSENENKVSNIWHLMSASNGLSDLSEVSSMRQRFDTIVGLSMDGKRVENGIERLTENGFTMKNPDNWNRHMLEKAADRDFVRRGWEGTAYYGSLEVRNVVSVNSGPIIYTVGGKSRKKAGLKKKQLFHIAEAIMESLKKTGMIDESAVLRSTNNGSTYSFYLDNSSERDSRLFASCMKQAASPLVCPKYIVRMGFIFKKYIAVPDVIASKKDNAALFDECIKEKTKLILVNTEEGRKLLLDQRLLQGTAEKNDVSMVRKLV
jgi:DNA or RNA helicases of superfamily II